jgi:hypothetical protein
MTEEEIKRWNTLMDQINFDIEYYRIEELNAGCDEEAYAWGQSAYVLNNVMKKIHNIIYDIIAEQYNKRNEPKGEEDYWDGDESDRITY